MEKKRKILLACQIMGEKKYWHGDNGRKKERKNIGMPNNERKNIVMEIPSHFQITNLFIAGGHLSLDLSLCIM